MPAAVCSVVHGLAVGTGGVWFVLAFPVVALAVGGWVFLDARERHGDVAPLLGFVVGAAGYVSVVAFEHRPGERRQ